MVVSLQVLTRPLFVALTRRHKRSRNTMHSRVRTHFNRIDRPAQSAARGYALAVETAESEGWPIRPDSPERATATMSGRRYFGDDGGPIAIQIHDGQGRWAIVQSMRAWRE
jgi:hypothetical protein